MTQLQAVPILFRKRASLSIELRIEVCICYSEREQPVEVQHIAGNLLEPE